MKRMPRRRRLNRRQRNQERWLVTYSDLITLLLVFFIIMFSMSSVDKTRFASLAQSLYAALHPTQQIALDGLNSSSILLDDNQNKAGTTDPMDGGAPVVKTDQSAAKKDQTQLDDLYNVVKGYITTHHLSNQVSIVNQQRGVQITMNDAALFHTGQAVLVPAAKKTIAGFVPFFKKLPNDIVVEGYTDNQPIHTSVYPSNWELSAARAMSVVHFLSSAGVKPARLSGTGYGQYNNVAPNDTAAHRQLNRRVNIVILRQDLQPGTAAAQPNANKKPNQTP